MGILVADFHDPLLIETVEIVAEAHADSSDPVTSGPDAFGKDTPHDRTPPDRYRPHQCRPDGGRARARDVLGYERASTDYREVLADRDVEVVSICAPNVLHAEMALAAAEAGKHVWIEKPAGRSAVETEAIAAATARSGASPTCAARSSPTTRPIRTGR